MCRELVSCGDFKAIRDFTMWYSEALVRRQKVKITSGDVMTRVPLRLPAVALLSYTGKCLVSRTLHYMSLSLLLLRYQYTPKSAILPNFSY